LPVVAKLDVIEQLLDNNGHLLAGGKVYTYAANSTTPLATYVDVDSGTANANPLVLDSSGRGDLWFIVGLAYKVVVQTSAGVVLKTVNGIKVPGDAIQVECDCVWTGPQTAASAWLCGKNIRNPWSFAANWSGAGGDKPKTLPAASYTITIKKTVAGVQTTVGTAVCDTSGNWTFATSGGAAVTFAIDDWIDFYGSGDADMADFSITLAGQAS
jgi:hypothetical protein